LGDPDHLTSFEISRLYNHWLNRQRKGLAPFVVLHAGPLHQPLEKKSQKSDKGKGKKKETYLPVDSDDEEEKEEDDEVEDNGEVNNEDDVVMDEDDVGPSEKNRGKPGPPSLKFGPPVGKARRRSPPVPGPSKLPPPKRSLKKGKALDHSESENDELVGRSRKKNQQRNSEQVSKLSEVIKCDHSS
jgi:hypothetical protein